MSDVQSEPGTRRIGVDLECDCRETISATFDEDDFDVNAWISCKTCGAKYAVTVTKISNEFEKNLW